MPTIPTPTSLVPALDGDDLAFAAKADAIVRGVVRATSPEQVYVVRIDNWFGGRWLGFAGKDCQHLYAWHDKQRLRIPPFVPKRVQAETMFVRSDDATTYALSPAPGRLHKAQRTDKNLDRWVDRLLPEAALFWISGDSTTSKHGAILAHVPTEGTHVAWYAGLLHDDEWRYGQSIDITVDMLDQYERLGVGSE